METYTYIDGGYFRENCTAVLQNLFAEVPPVDFSRMRQELKADRVFYYDCLAEGDERGTEGEEQLQGILKRIKAADFYHLRYGTLRGKRRSQKELDVLLAVDMLTDAFYKNMTRAILVSGDLDFRPALESLVRLGVTVSVVYDPRHVAEELTLAADVRIPIDAWWAYRVTETEYQRRNCMPRRVWYRGLSQPEIKAGVLRRGDLNGKAVVHYDNGNQCLVTIDDGDERVEFTHPCADFLLNRYLPQVEGDVQWHD